MHLNSRKQPFFRHSVGDGTACQNFVLVQSKPAIRKIFDEKGKVISEEPTEVPFLSPLPSGEQLHPITETADMYKIPNLEKLGVKLTPVQGNFIPLSLEQQSIVRQNADCFDFDSLNQDSNNNQTTINFSSNEG